MVNLLPCNPFQVPAFLRPSYEVFRRFLVLVRAGGLGVYIRTPGGEDIEAAWGQLAARPGPELVPLRT
jgi:adenine C2-methylase RlmN of 23S rRNA A2503 and tRNA A37